MIKFPIVGKGGGLAGPAGQNAPAAPTSDMDIIHALILVAVENFDLKRENAELKRHIIEQERMG